MIGSCHSIIEGCIGWQMITIFSSGLGSRVIILEHLYDCVRQVETVAICIELFQVNDNA